MERWKVKIPTLAKGHYMGVLLKFLTISSYIRTIPNGGNKSFKKSPKMEQLHRPPSMLESHEYDRMFP